jgi:hypothetical protein
MRPGKHTYGYVSNDLSQKIREPDFREVREVVRRNGHFQTASGDLHRECLLDCGGRTYPGRDRDHSECCLLDSMLGVEAFNRSC